MQQSQTRASTVIMAILNVTPDSFSDGGVLSGLDAVLQAAEAAIQAGATILDIGGESTRPGAPMVPVEEEIRRVVPVLSMLREAFPDVTQSIDTRKAAVAEAALVAGADIVNDVSGLQFDPVMAEVVARHQARLILMHSQGTPETMQTNPSYPQGVVPELFAFFERQIALAESAGIPRVRIILDPGFGFGKTVAHNLELLANLSAFKPLGCPLLVGTSRKSFLTLKGKAQREGETVLSEEAQALTRKKDALLRAKSTVEKLGWAEKSLPVDEREALTAASLALALSQGAAYVRVHDVATQAPVIRLIDATLNHACGSYSV